MAAAVVIAGEKKCHRNRHAVAVGGTRFTLDALGGVPPTPDEMVWNDDAGAS